MSHLSKLIKYSFLSLFIFGCLVLTSSATPHPIDVKWKPVGIGGGGGIFNPSISPHDKNLIFVSCDMGGWYRSTDGARTWRMVNGYDVGKVNYPAAFHPTDPNIIYVSTRGGVKRSTDRGKTWEHVLGKFEPANPDSAGAIAFDPGKPNVIWVYFSTYLGEKGHFLVRATDSGKTWAPHPGWPYKDKEIQKIIFDPNSPVERRHVFLLANGALYRSDDDGMSWEVKTDHFPLDDKVSDFAAAWDRKLDTQVIFITLPSQLARGKFLGGVYKSVDGGDTWQQVIRGLEIRPYKGKLQQYERLAMSSTNTRILYVSSKGPGMKPPFCPTVWRSKNGGNTWKPILFGEPSWKNSNVDPDWLTLELSWWWGGIALGLACNPKDPYDLLFTDMGRSIRTTNGGKWWFPISTRRTDANGDAWEGRGLEVSTSYEYYFDPHDPNRTYITYTDFGMTRSLDHGKSWIWAGRGSPWSNSCYELAFDPDRPGIVFGAWGQAHDLPHWKMIFKGEDRISRFRGGVTRSNDYCAKWKPLGRGQLPEAAATTLVIDPNSPKNSRTIYVGLFNKGVYKSTNDGKTWTRKDKGLGFPSNMNVWRLDLHPDGTLLCGVTLAYVDGKPNAGALYRSTDGAETWEKVNNTQPLSYIWGVRMDPRDSKTIYVSCFDIPPEGFKAFGTSVPWPPSEGGGVFKTSDGGKTWKKILEEPWCWDVTFDPEDPDIVYAGTFYGGVYRSTDAGKTWQKLKGLPFVCPQRVTVDPRDRKTIYVTTFGGGVWKGRLP